MIIWVIGKGTKIRIDYSKHFLFLKCLDDIQRVFGVKPMVLVSFKIGCFWSHPMRKNDSNQDFASIPTLFKGDSCTNFLIFVYENAAV